MAIYVARFNDYDELAVQMSSIKRLVFLLFISYVWAQNDEDCSGIDCGFAIPICSPDSVLVKHKAEVGKCCPPDASCQCKYNF